MEDTSFLKNVIPFFGIKRQYASLREELLEVIDAVYKSGQVLDGNYTKEFERQMAKRCHRKYAVAVGSGTQALIFAQQLLFQEPAKILIPTISFVATINSILLNGNEPVLCDTDDQALINLESLDYAVKGAGVSGIMYVNIFGNTVDYDRFRMLTEFFNKDLSIIEDAAQSFGASYKGIPSGAMGDISILSFDPTKNLNNYGSGGMLLCDNLADAKILMDLRDNGKTNDHDYPGTNSKMSESDCAQMLVKLKHFDAWQRRRTAIAEYYIKELYPHLDILIPNSGTTHAWHKFVIRVDNRNSLQNYLHRNGIETRIHYDQALSDMSVGFNYVDYSKQLFTETSAFTRECLSLPMYPELEDYEVETIIEVIKQYYAD